MHIMVGNVRLIAKHITSLTTYPKFLPPSRPPLSLYIGYVVSATQSYVRAVIIWQAVDRLWRRSVACKLKNSRHFLVKHTHSHHGYDRAAHTRTVYYEFSNTYKTHQSLVQPTRVPLL